MSMSGVPLLSRTQMQSLDRIAIEDVGLPSLALMEVAARAVLDALLELHQADPGLVVVLAGTGNNGGDAACVARHLFVREIPVELILLGTADQASPELGQQLSILRRLGLNVSECSEESALSELDVRLLEASQVVDGIFGTGLSREITGWRRAVVEAVNESEVPVVSIDIPSGIDADTGQVLGAAIDAVTTVTFQYAQPGHVLYPGRAYTGDLRVADIGLPPLWPSNDAPRAFLLDDHVISEAVLPRAPNSHKGSFGHLMVVAGVPDRPGAALLAARAGLRAGTGLVTLGSDATTVGRLAPSFGEIMGVSLGDMRIDGDRLIEALQPCTALTIGPSLPADTATQDVLRKVMTSVRVPVVFDAGALGALGADLEIFSARPGPTILTPHPGEMARMLGVDTRAVQQDRIEVARRVASVSKATVVLKGASTVIGEPDGTIHVVVRGNPGMATAGTGDVLAGVIGGLLAQGVEPGLAARAGVQIHARAGDLAAEELGEHGVIASDLLRFLPAALSEADIPPSEGM